MIFHNQFHMTAIKIFQWLSLVLCLSCCTKNEPLVSCELTTRAIEYVHNSNDYAVTTDSLFISSSAEFSSNAKKYKMEYESDLLSNKYIQIFNLYVNSIEQLDTIECAIVMSGMQSFDMIGIEDLFGNHSGSLRIVYEPILYKNNNAYLILNYRIKKFVANSVFFHFNYESDEWKLASAQDLIFH